MMLSLIVDGFIIIDYVSSAMMLSSIVYWIRLLQSLRQQSLRQQSPQSLRQQSLRQQSLRQAWIRLEVTWENILCVLPPFFHWLLLLRVRVLVSCQSSYNSLWFNVIDQTIANRVVQSSYLRWPNFQQPANFLVCTLVDIFHQYYLWWYNYTTTLLWWTLLL